MAHDAAYRHPIPVVRGDWQIVPRQTIWQQSTLLSAFSTNQ